MRPVVNGVLMPDELIDAPPVAQEQHATEAKTASAAFCSAYHALEDRAAELGLTMEDLDS